MITLYLCGAGNPEGVRLALTVNRAQNRWERIVILDDDPSKQRKLILGVEIAGPFSLLERADPTSTDVANLVARTTKGRQSALRKIETYGIPFATLIDPSVDTMGVEFGRNITVYRTAFLSANATLGEGTVVFAGALAGHGCQIGRGCVLAPGAVINARVELGEGVYVGTNASILPDLKIGPWATIGANSAVVQDVPSGATVMGVPAQVLILDSSNRSVESSNGPAAEQQNPNRPCDPTTLESEKTEIKSRTLKQLRLAQEKYIESYRLTNDDLIHRGEKRID